MSPECDFSGRTLEGRYALVRKIGAGSFATVYLGQDLRMFGRKIAVKVLHPERGESTGNVDRFVQEMKVAAKLDGPYRDRVVKIIDHGRCEAEAPTLLYLVMEHVEGVTLHALLNRTEDGQKRRRPMPWQQAAAVIRELVKALATLHACGVVHRDIKPGNCIIEQKPDGDFLKLLDLGIVKVLPGHEISGHGPRTHPEFVLGTPRYMAPEQFAGPCNDARVDLYAAGIMLYEFLTGDVPSRWFERPGARHPYVPIPPSQARPDVGIPPELDAVALKAIAFEPDRRFQTAAEFASALAEILLAAEHQRARARVLAEDSLSRPRLGDGLRAAFAIGDLDARGWVALRWWLTIATTCVAMRFAVGLASVLRHDRHRPAMASAEASSIVRARPPAKGKADRQAKSAVEPKPRVAEVKPPVASPPVAGPPVAAPAPGEPPPAPPIQRPAARPKPRPPDPPPIWPSTRGLVEAEAERQLGARCRGVKGSAVVTVAVDVADARVTGVEVAADAKPALRACVERHGRKAFLFTGLSKRAPVYTFTIDL